VPRSKHPSTLLHEARYCISECLPLPKFLLQFDMLLFVLKEYENGELLTVKKLFASFPYSHTGLRYHFDKLVKEDWLLLDNDAVDKRTKIVKPSKKLLLQFDILISRLHLIHD
jgi:hypothetical protein